MRPGFGPETLVLVPNTFGLARRLSGRSQRSPRIAVWCVLHCDVRLPGNTFFARNSFFRQCSHSLWGDGKTWKAHTTKHGSGGPQPAPLTSSAPPPDPCNARLVPDLAVASCFVRPKRSRSEARVSEDPMQKHGNPCVNMEFQMQKHGNRVRKHGNPEKLGLDVPRTPG